MARALLALAASLALAPAAPAQTQIPPGARPPAAGPQKADTLATPPPAPAPRSAEPPATPKVLPRGAVMEEVSGSVRGMDRSEHRLSLDTPSGGVTLSLDRNTMVYTPTGLGTVLDIVPGAQIRAGRNADFLAYWVQVRAVGAKAPATPPGQGTGPAGSSGPPPAETPGTGGAVAPASSPTPAPPGPGGGVTRGTGG